MVRVVMLVNILDHRDDPPASRRVFRIMHVLPFLPASAAAVGGARVAKAKPVAVAVGRS